MSYLLDTNVVSELRKPARRADPQVRSWVTSRRPSDLHLSVITILEVELGIARMHRRDHAQAQRLQSWLDERLLDAFAGRILPVDLAAVRRAAHLHAPFPRPERDALIAATAAVHGLTVVTRNVKDFAPLEVTVANPWESRPRLTKLSGQRSSVSPGRHGPARRRGPAPGRWRRARHRGRASQAWRRADASQVQGVGTGNHEVVVAVHHQDRVADPGQFLRSLPPPAMHCPELAQQAGHPRGPVGTFAGRHTAQKLIRPAPQRHGEEQVVTGAFRVTAACAIARKVGPGTRVMRLFRFGGVVVGVGAAVRVVVLGLTRTYSPDQGRSQADEVNTGWAVPACDDSLGPLGPPGRRTGTATIDNAHR
ncbi:type II toxin-antitoxin system VapC family toxin [Actinomyces ruminis]|uniref:Ribonuclease VapC n=1 Tax=Actinomyces ruminis TaxID=1937003 RepID=A0ABX4MB49_9ACTO|nr:type II toxin-antitoxin system VapC family toxin [Actinomyces ruminis]PHP52481.1 PIN domain-containing protein [Actinomyces ruminis]